MENNKEKLVRLINENPKLPLVYMVCNDDLAEGFGYTVFEDFVVHKSTIYEYEKYGGMFYSDDVSEVVEWFMDYFCDEDEYKDLDNEEYERKMQGYVEENVLHYDAIVIYVR